MVKKMMMNLDDDVDEVLRKSVPHRKGELMKQVNRLLRAGLGMDTQKPEVIVPVVGIRPDAQSDSETT